MPDPIKAGTPPAPAPAAPPAVPPAPVPTPPPAALKPGESPAAGVPQPNMVPLTALQEEREKRQSLQSEVEQLKRIVGQNVLYDINGNPVAPPVQQQPQVDPIRAEVEKLWESDPRKAVQTELMMAIDWYDRQNASMDAQEAEASARYQDFNDYRNAARRYVRSLPIQQRNQQGVWDAAYYFARGQKVDDIVARERESLTNKFRAGEFPPNLPAGAFTPPPVASAVSLSADELKVCEVMGIKPEEYLANKRN